MCRKLRHGCLIFFSLFSPALLFSQHDPDSELKSWQGYRLIMLGQGMLEVSSEVPSWVKSGEVGLSSNYVASMLTSLQKGYVNSGRLLITAGLAKELAYFYYQDPGQSFRKLSEAARNEAVRFKYQSLVKLLLDVYWTASQLKLDLLWFDALLDALEVKKGDRDSYLAFRSGLETLRPPADATEKQQENFASEANRKTQAFIESLLGRGAFVEFQARGHSNPLLVSIRSIFGGLRIYAVGIGSSGQASIPIASLLSKAILKRPLPKILKNTLDNTAISSSGGTLFLIRGRDGESDPRFSRFTATGYTQNGARIALPTFSNTANRSSKEVSVMVKMNFFLAEEPLEGFQVTDLDGLFCAKLSMSNNVFNVGTPWLQKVTTGLSKLYDAEDALSFIKTNVRWSLGQIESDDSLEGKIPTKILTFSLGEFTQSYAKGTSFSGYAEIAGEFAPFQIEGPDF